MRASAFEVAGIHLQFAGESDDIETLKRLFKKFPTPQRLCPDVAVALEKSRCSWKTPQSSGSIRLLDPHATTAAATMLLARLLSEASPQVIVLHGNALLHPKGHPLLLLGDSGTGKTTLTRQLLSPPSSLSQVAEDVLVFDPDQQLLHPFPRALALRTGDEISAEHASFGFADETGRGRPLEDFTAEARPARLENAAVFLLSFPESSASRPRPEHTPTGERAWVSWADGQTADTLRQAGLPIANVRIGDSIAVMDFDRPLSNDERALQHRLFDKLEILHLHSAPIHSPIQNPIEPEAPQLHPCRPESPQCEPLGPGEGIRGCLTHLRRVTGAQSQGEASRVFLRLAKALSSSRFFRLVPGGTPDQTAQLLAHNAAREISPV